MSNIATTPVPNNNDVNTSDMQLLIYDEINRKGIAGHHIDSMNTFYNTGIKQIVTQLFSVYARIKNTRNKTTEDLDITDIVIDVRFTDIKLTRPTTTKYRSGAIQALMPNLARLRNLTYSGHMNLDAEVTVTATHKNGTKTVREATITDYHIASMPIMVGSELCNTYRQPEQWLKSMQEDPRDPGGYFIIKGGEWTLDSFENLVNNSFHVHKNEYKKEITRGTLLSKSGDAFENSYQLIMRYNMDGSITIEVTTAKYKKFVIPFYLLFRAMGMTSDRDIISHIIFADPEDEEVKSKPDISYMLNILKKAFIVEDPLFKPVMYSNESIEIINHIAHTCMDIANPVLAKADANVDQYLNTQVTDTFDRYILPHVGTTSESRIAKVRYMAYLINTMLKVEMEVLDSTDRDSYKNKRVHTAGTSLAKAFKTNFNLVIAQGIRERLVRSFRDTSFSQVVIDEVFKSAIKPDDLERAMTQSISSGARTITIKRAEVTNRMSSQSLYRKNDMNTISTLSTITTPNTSSKQNQRADEMRRVHPTYLGYVDVSQSADTGEKVGMNKVMACTASVTTATSGHALKRAILNEKVDGEALVVPLDDIDAISIGKYNLGKVFVNGDWIGVCSYPHDLVRHFRQLRRQGGIHHTTSIVWEALSREVKFWTDVGRMIRPLVIVYNNYEEYIKAWRSGVNKTPPDSVDDRGNVDESKIYVSEPSSHIRVPFRQWIKLSSKHIEGLRMGTIDMDDLREEGVVEYITPEEQESTYIANNLDTLRDHASNPTHMYTHCDIDQAIFGIVTLSAPLSNHSNSVRNTMFTNHRKQSSGWYALNWPYRIDKNTFLQYYNEVPLVKTFSDSVVVPNVQNTIIALALYGAENAEDGIIYNKTSVDCGMFNGCQFKYEKTELERYEEIKDLEEAVTMDIKRDVVYDHCVDGLVPIGKMVQRNDALVVKRAKMSKPVNNYTHTDKTMVYRADEPAFVEQVVVSQNDDDVTFATVKLRSPRPTDVGDKFCTTPDHDVLTRDGWKPIADVTLDDEVACLVDGQYLEYHKPTETHEFDHDGDIYVIDSMHIKTRTTLNHRMFVSKRKHARPDEYQLEAVKDIMGKPRYYKKDAIWNAPDVETYTCSYEHDVYTEKNDKLITGGAEWPDLVFDMDDWLEFLGIWLSDGNLVKANHCQVLVTCTKQRKVDRFNAVCERMGLKVSRHGKSHFIYSSQIYAMLKPYNLGAPNKHLPDYVWDVSQRQARILMDALISGDGSIHKKNGHVSFCTSSERLADDVVRLALHCGWSGYKYMDKAAGYQADITKNGVTRTITARHASWKIGINKSNNNPGINCHRKIHDSVEHYKGKVYCLTVPSAVFLVKHGNKPHWTGNSSRSANKGIVTKALPRHDMPYTEDGVVPDMIINTHSIPTRMAINQLIECTMAQLAAERGTIMDATAFNKIDIDKIIKDLETEFGVKYGGHKRMYNGRTGDWFDSLIFVGPTGYQRLMKFIADDNYATRSGPTQALTRQPLEGKANDGGLRIGEMEKDVLVGQGVMRALWEKFNEDSDGITIHVCRVCGDRAVVNERKGIYKCLNCGDNADIAAVPSSWCANLFFNEAAAMNIKMKFKLDPHTY